MFAMGQTRAVYLTWIGITIGNLPPPQHVCLQYRAIPYILPQFRAEQCYLTWIGITIGNLQPPTHVC